MTSCRHAVDRRFLIGDLLLDGHSPEADEIHLVAQVLLFVNYFSRPDAFLLDEVRESLQALAGNVLKQRGALESEDDFHHGEHGQRAL